MIIRIHEKHGKYRLQKKCLGMFWFNINLDGTKYTKEIEDVSYTRCYTTAWAKVRLLNKVKLYEGS